MSSETPVFDTPEAAETAFYFALERASLETMMSIWEASDDIVCIHPLGPRLRGREQVREGWRQIFGGGTPLRFAIDAVHSAGDAGIAVRMVIEHITVLGAAADQQPAQPVLATNVYRRDARGWRLLLHHASPGAELSPVSRPAASQALH